MTRWQKTFFAAGILLAGSIGLYVFVDPQEEKAAATPPQAELPTSAITERTVKRAAEDRNAVAQSSEPRTERAKLSEEESRAIEQGLARIVSLAEKCEVENHAVFYDHETPAGRTTILRVRPPDSEQMAEIYGSLNQSLKVLRRESPAETALRERGLQLIDEYTSYPKQLKMLMITPHDFLELYVNDENVMKPNEQGGIAIPFPLKSDAKFGEPDSWATKRYRHLFPWSHGRSPTGDGADL